MQSSAECDFKYFPNFALPEFPTDVLSVKYFPFSSLIISIVKNIEFPFFLNELIIFFI